MCIPQPKDPAPPATNVPSMAAASALDLGGTPPRGAAGLGRLKLRTGKTQAPVAAKKTSQVEAAQTPTDPTPARAGGDYSSPYLRAYSPNAGLTLPIPA